MGARGAIAPSIFYILVNVYLVIYIVMKLFILHMILNEPPQSTSHSYANGMA